MISTCGCSICEIPWATTCLLGVAIRNTQTVYKHLQSATKLWICFISKNKLIDIAIEHSKLHQNIFNLTQVILCTAHFSFCLSSLITITIPGSSLQEWTSARLLSHKLCMYHHHRMRITKTQKSNEITYNCVM